jgi:hypothetical protein
VRAEEKAASWAAADWMGSLSGRERQDGREAVARAAMERTRGRRDMALVGRMGWSVGCDKAELME